jgi:DNA-3-methyladenine glycosylase
MSERRGVIQPTLLAHGLGRLSQALALNLASDGGSLLEQPFSMVRIAHHPVVVGPRIGIAKATERP